MQLSAERARDLLDAVRDLRVAMRRARREPGLTIAIVLTMGLGLGAATAIFTAFRAALLEPPPFAHPDRLVHVWEQRPGANDRSPTSYPTLLDWRARAVTFSGLEGYNPTNATVGVEDDARMLRGAQVTTGFFRLLGVGMAAGRDFAAGEDAGGAGVAIVSRRFADGLARGGAVGRTITVNGTPYVVVGVLPAVFQFAPLQDADVWLPLAPGQPAQTDRTVSWISVIGRLRPGTRLAEARADLAKVMTELGGEYPRELGGRTVVAAPLTDVVLGTVKPILMSLMGAVVLLLAVMCTNLALLMLTRHLGRGRELAIRTALGATRVRIHRQLFAESIALTIPGVLLALAVGDVGVRLLVATIPDGVAIGMPYLAGVGLDGVTVMVVALSALLLSLVFGLGPATLAARASDPTLGTRTVTMSREHHRLRRGLVAAQIAVTVVLLVAAGLLGTSLRNLLRTDIGIGAPKQLVSARVSLSGPRYGSSAAQQAFFAEVLERAAALPGVRDVGAISQLPLGGGRITTFEGVGRPRPPGRRPRAAMRVVAGRYFSTMQIPLRAGRMFTDGDRSDAPPVAVVSAGMARRLARNGAVLGQHIRLGATDTTEWEVVGVVGDVQVAALDLESPPAVYVSHLQVAENRMSVVVRTTIVPAGIGSGLRTIVRALDASVPVYAVTTIDRQIRDARAVFSRRFPMTLCIAFALSALSLALVGIYSLCAHDVLTRRREFAIRLALGASPGHVRATILTGGLTLIVVGVAIGVAAAISIAGALQPLLFGVHVDDWRVYGAVAAGATGAAFLATLLPTVRAGRVNPITVMGEA